MLLSISFTHPSSLLADAPSQETIQSIPNSLEFGTILLGSRDRLSGEASVKNLSNATVTLERVTISCGCVKALPRFKKIAPKGSGTIEISVALNAERRGIHLVSLTLSVGKRTEELRIPIRWETRHPIKFASVTPDSHPETNNDEIAFGKLKGGQVATRVVTLSHRDSEEPIEVQSVTSPYDFIAAKLLSPSKIELRLEAPERFSIIRNATLAIEATIGGVDAPLLNIPVELSKKSIGVGIHPPFATVQTPNGQPDSITHHVFTVLDEPISIEKGECVTDTGMANQIPFRIQSVDELKRRLRLTIEVRRIPKDGKQLMVYVSDPVQVKFSIRLIRLK